MRYYCTYFDRNYLARALVLLESLQQHETSEHRIIIICLDEYTRLALSQLQDPRFILLSRHALEHADQALVEPRQKRSIAEYFWTLSPTALLHAMQHVPVGEPLFYIDADLCFFSDPAQMLAEMDGHSVLIHEHRYSPELAPLAAQSGRFNVGLMGFRNDATGMEVLHWWRERCNEWCYAYSEDGKFGDQMYLDDWPTRFPGVRILAHPGAGVAPWNQGALHFSPGDAPGALLVEGQPLVFFHFHAMVPINAHVYLLVKHGIYPMPWLVVQHAYFPYVKRQEHWNDWLRGHTPGLVSGYTPQQALFGGAALLLRSQVAQSIEHVEKVPMGDDWVLLPGSRIQT